MKTGETGCTARPSSVVSQNRSMAAPPRTYQVGSARGTVMTASPELVRPRLVRIPSAWPARQSARCPMTSGRRSRSPGSPRRPGPSPGCARPCPLRANRVRASGSPPSIWWCTVGDQEPQAVRTPRAARRIRRSGRDRSRSCRRAPSRSTPRLSIATVEAVDRRQACPSVGWRPWY